MREMSKGLTLGVFSRVGRIEEKQLRQVKENHGKRNASIRFYF